MDKVERSLSRSPVDWSMAGSLCHHARHWRAARVSKRSTI